MHKAFIYSFVMNPAKACCLGTAGCCCPFVLSLSHSREKQTVNVLWTTSRGERHRVFDECTRLLCYMLVLQWKNSLLRSPQYTSNEMIAPDRFQIKSFVLTQWTGTNGRHLITAFTVTDFQIAYWFFAQKLKLSDCRLFSAWLFVLFVFVLLQ